MVEWWRCGGVSGGISDDTIMTHIMAGNLYTDYSKATVILVSLVNPHIISQSQSIRHIFVRNLDLCSMQCR